MKDKKAIKSFIYAYNDVNIFEDERKKYIEDKNNLIAIYGEKLPAKNIRIGNQYYKWCSCCIRDGKQYFFVEPYDINNSPEKQRENQNNAYCPVCNYVDYFSWECKEGDYKCPRCKSQFILDKRCGNWYDEDNAIHYQRLTLQKVYKPKQLRNMLLEVNNDG